MKCKKEQTILKVKVMNPPSEKIKKELIRKITMFIQDTYYM